MIYNRSCRVNLKSKRSFYNDQFNVKLNTQSDGSFFYGYMPSQNEFGSYSVNDKNDLDTSPFVKQLNCFYLGMQKLKKYLFKLIVKTLTNL